MPPIRIVVDTNAINSLGRLPPMTEMERLRDLGFLELRRPYRSREEAKARDHLVPPKPFEDAGELLVLGVTPLGVGLIGRDDTPKIDLTRLMAALFPARRGGFSKNDENDALIVWTYLESGDDYMVTCENALADAGPALEALGFQNVRIRRPADLLA